MRKGMLWVLMLTALTFSCGKKYLDKPKDVAPHQVSMVLKGITKKVGNNVGGYFAGLPDNYSTDSKRYPLLLYIHGGGQFGNGDVDLPNLLSEGIPALLDTKMFPATITSQGKVYSFIVLAPQFILYPNNNDIQQFLDYARSNYSIDSSRIYVTGFSIGGRITCEYAAEKAASLAAIVPMAGACTGSVEDKCRNMANYNLPVWAFHNEQDEFINVYETENFISTLNRFRPEVPAKVTIFKQSTALLKHDAWTRATDPSYRENGMNIYEWMLQFKR